MVCSRWGNANMMLDANTVRNMNVVFKYYSSREIRILCDKYNEVFCHNIQGIMDLEDFIKNRTFKSK